ncbi:MAG: hypothetical protein ACOZBZ_00880 [Patescibacteria group bacterium]
MPDEIGKENMLTPEQQPKQEKAARLEREEKLRIAKEKIPLLLGVLEKFRCRELLTQIRDEIWRLGEVSIAPELNKIDHDTALKAEVILKIQWPVFIEKGRSYNSASESFDEWGDHLSVHEELLVIRAVYGEKEQIFIKIADDYWGHEKGSIMSADPEAPRKLEELLIEDYLRRWDDLYSRKSQPPYD